MLDTASDDGTSGGSRLRIAPNPLRVRAMFAGHVIADTTHALTVHEPGGAPVHFFPRRDVETGYLGRTTAVTHDPLKGEACCYTLVMEGEIVERAVCVYENPPPGAEAIRDHICFCAPEIEVYELTREDMAAAPRAPHRHGSAA